MLEKINQIQNRIEQIEARIEARAQGEPEAFRRHLEGASQRTFQPPVLSPNPMVMNMHQIAGINPQLWSMINPSAYGATGRTDVNVLPQAQSNDVSCGQTSVAMSINALTGKSLRDTDVDARYGFELLKALNGECREAGWRWQDGGEINPSCWSLIDHKVNVERTPVIVALNGPEFSPSGRGHIVTILKTEGDTVTYADPADGTVKTTTKQRMNTASSHPDGNFIFFANREAPVELPNVAAQPHPYPGPLPY